MIFSLLVSPVLAFLILSCFTICLFFSCPAPFCPSAECPASASPGTQIQPSADARTKISARVRLVNTAVHRARLRIGGLFHDLDEVDFRHHRQRRSAKDYSLDVARSNSLVVLVETSSASIRFSRSFANRILFSEQVMGPRPKRQSAFCDNSVKIPCWLHAHPRRPLRPHYSALDTG